MPVITRELENVEAGGSVSIEGLLDGVDYKGLREPDKPGDYHDIFPPIHFLKK
jgi:hypothetical protein